MYIVFIRVVKYQVVSCQLYLCIIRRLPLSAVLDVQSNTCNSLNEFQNSNRCTIFHINHVTMCPVLTRDSCIWLSSDRHQPMDPYSVSHSPAATNI